MLDQLVGKLDLIREVAAKETLVVTGAAKSGTTWLQRMLNSHPEIYCPGEGKFREFALGFVNAANEYNKRLAYTNQVVYSEGGAFYRPWDDGNVAAGIQFLMALSWATSEHKDLARVRYIGDKDTQYADNIEIWRDQVLKDARFIHVIRDGRDSAVSIAFHKKRTGAFKLDADFHKFLDSYARGWANRVRVMREAFATCPERYHEVRYEDLLADPGSHLSGVLGFLAVDSSPELIGRIVEENSFKRLSGGRASGQEDQTSFYRKGVAGDWQAHFDERARQVFADASGGMLAELGYTH